MSNKLGTKNNFLLLNNTFQRLISPEIYLPLIGLSILILLPVGVRNAYYLQIAITTLWYAYLGSAWNIAGGMAGQFSLGQGAFIGIGAYTSTVLFRVFGISPWIGMIIGGVIAIIIAFCIGYPSSRLTGAYYVLTSIGFLAVIRIFFQSQETILGFETRGGKGLTVPCTDPSFLSFQFREKTYYYYIILMLLLLVIFITWLISNSKMGYCLRAIRENQEAAESIGINVTKYKIIAVTITAFFTALAGTFYAQLMYFIEPSGVFGAALSEEMAIIAIIGGRQVIMGPMVGALILMPISDIIRSYFTSSLPGIHMIIYGVFLILVMIFKPTGIIGFFDSIYNYILRKLKPQKRLQP